MEKKWRFLSILLKLFDINKLYTSWKRKKKSICSLNFRPTDEYNLKLDYKLHDLFVIKMICFKTKFHVEMNSTAYAIWFILTDLQHATCGP